jgi:hypothetical protein
MAGPISTGLDALVFLRISHSVGKGGSNRYGDVQLIQFLLNVIHMDPGSLFRMPFLLSLDGICGQRTLSAIVGYQEHKKRSESPVVTVDGLVTATRHAIFMDPRRFGFSTIYCLNWDYLMAVPRTNFGEMFLGLATEPLYSSVILPLRNIGVI